MAKKKARVRQSIPIDETKSARFKRVVTPRVNKALKAIKVVGYCSGSTYEYTPDQVEAIIVALNEAVIKTGSKFAEKSDTEAVFDFNA